jgi:hypothetical protein
LEVIVLRKTMGLSILAACAAVAFAAPASADQDEFVRQLRERYVYLTPEQLITAGNKICALNRSGKPSAESQIMVSEYLGISVPAAGRIVNLANVELGC